MPTENRIRELRKQLHMSQEALGKELGGLSAMSISRYENGVSPDIDTLTKMANIFKCSVDYLTGHSDTKGYIFDTKHILNAINAIARQDGEDNGYLDIELIEIEFAEEISKKYGLTLDDAKEISLKAEDVFFNVCAISERESDLIDAFELLNELGRRTAMQRLEELAKIPEYQKKVDSCPEQPKMPEQSENEKTDSGKPE